MGEKAVKPEGADSNEPQQPDLDRLRRDLDLYMNKQGLRSTGQRRAIIDTFFDTSEHLTIEQLLELVHKRDKKIGYATVYRTLKMLVACGIVHEHNFGDGATRYELADEKAHHDHLICTECGRITEFEEPLIELLQDRIASRYDFVVEHHKHELYGHCRDPENCPHRGEGEK